MYKCCFVLLAAMFLASCNGGGNVSVQQDEPHLVIRLANELKPDSRIWDASQFFIEEVSKASEDGDVKAGEVEVVFYDQGTIGSERALLENCYYDVIEMVQVNSSIVTTLDDAYNVLDLPYLFLDKKQHEKVLYGELGQTMLDELGDYGLVGLGFYGTGFRNLFYKRKGGPHAVSGPKDLRGIKIRVMESPTMISAIGAMGATASPIPFSELFTSIKTGVVDGAENSAKIFMSYKYYEAGVNQFTMTEHFANQHVIIANAGWFNSLAPKYRKHIKEAIHRSQLRFDIMWGKVTEESMEALRDNGVNINYLHGKSSFVEQSDKVIRDFSRKYPELKEKYVDKILAIRNSEK